MKVWIVRTPSDPMEPWDVDGVFTTLEKATEYKKMLPEWKDVAIEEWETDKPNAKISVDEKREKQP